MHLRHRNDTQRSCSKTSQLGGGVGKGYSGYFRVRVCRWDSDALTLDQTKLSCILQPYSRWKKMPILYMDTGVQPPTMLAEKKHPKLIFFLLSTALQQSTTTNGPGTPEQKGTREMACVAFFLKLKLKSSNFRCFTFFFSRHLYRLIFEQKKLNFG